VFLLYASEPSATAANPINANMRNRFTILIISAGRFDYIGTSPGRRRAESCAILARNAVEESVFSAREPVSQAAPVSQKLSQQYSRQARVRRVISDFASFTFRHSADQPASPETRLSNSSRMARSHWSRAEFPSLTQTK
jgi:hypothetical protein